MLDPISILVVDDSGTMRSTVSLALATAGYRVSAAGDGLEALRMLSQQEYDLVLTDVLMPEMDGFLLMREIRRHHPHLPIVVMSGGGTFLTEDYCLRTARLFGASAVLPKPFEPQQLLAVVESMVGQPSVR